MAITAYSVGGGAILTQLLGQNLAAEMLDPGKSAQGTTTTTKTTAATTQTAAAQAADSVLLSPEAQQLLQTLQNTVLTNRSTITRDHSRQFYRGRPADAH